MSVGASLLLVLLMCFGYGEIRLYAFSCYIRVSLLSAGQIHSLFDVSRDKYMDGRGIKNFIQKHPPCTLKRWQEKKLFSIQNGGLCKAIETIMVIKKVQLLCWVLFEA